MDNRKYKVEKIKLSSVYGELLEPMVNAAQDGDPLARILLLQERAPINTNEKTSIQCNYTDAEIANAFIEDVKSVKKFLDKKEN